MSGIFGFWNLDGRPADPSLLATMSAALAHRGPDGWDGRCDGPVALGHRMFRTTPESACESQPLVSRDGTRVLTADVRLDNRDELIRRLDVRGGPSRGLPDPEFLLCAYDARGREAPALLLGAFSFAVWDARRHELLCARDHFGEKPLYYFHSPGRLFAFASEIKALLALDEVPNDVDDLEVARHLLIPVAEDLGSTYFRAIRRLLPGHTLTVTSEGVEEREYWSLDPTRSLVLSSDEEYAEVVRDTFIEAVRCRLRSSGPVASMLSGGLDSSSVTCVATRLLVEQGSDNALRTLSAVYPDVPASDERHCIGTVLEACGAQASFFRADQVSPLAELDEMNWYGDGASKAGNLYLNWNLYRTASAGGARVVLDGFDGDTTLSHGDGWLLELALTRRWWTLAREVKAKAGVVGESWPAALQSWARTYALAPAIRRLPGVRSRRRLAADSDDTRRWSLGLAPAFRRALSGQIVRRPAARTEREHHHRLMLRPSLLHTLDWIGAVGAGAGVEVRAPFFDVRLAELCLSLPPTQKLRRGWSRFVMREAMAGILPDEIRRRPDKSNMEHGFNHALRTHARARLGSDLWKGERIARYLDPAVCAELQHRFMTGAEMTEEEGLRFWRSASLALWLAGSDRAYVAHESRGWDDVPALAARGLTREEV